MVQNQTSATSTAEHIYSNTDMLTLLNRQKTEFYHEHPAVHHEEAVFLQMCANKQ